MAMNGKKAAGTQAGAMTVGHALCHRVRELNKKGWTLEQTSAACGVSKSMLSEISADARTPRLRWRIASLRRSA